MRKSKKKSNTEQTIEDILAVAGDPEVEETENEEKKAEEEKDDEYDKNGIVVVVDRIEHGLIGSLYIKDSKINKPLIKPGDYVHFRAYSKLLPKDIILYKDHDEYFIRRIIKFEDNEIWCAGDNERHFRIIHKDNVVAKALGRIRGKKFLSFGLENFSYKYYAIRKSYFNGIRLANRVMTFDQETNTESFELAMQNFEQLQATQAQQATQGQEEYKIAADIDLDSDLADFLNPDDLVLELQREKQEMVEEEVYIDADGNEITKEEYEAYLKEHPESEDEESEFADDEVASEAEQTEEAPTEETQAESTEDPVENEEAQAEETPKEEVQAETAEETVENTEETASDDNSSEAPQEETPSEDENSPKNDESEASDEEVKKAPKIQIKKK